LFIDEVQDGELTIHTDDVSYSAVSDEIINYNSFIRGTMIAWKIKVGDDKCI
jgi:hypothetical protein